MAAFLLAPILAHAEFVGEEVSIIRALSSDA